MSTSLVFLLSCYVDVNPLVIRDWLLPLSVRIILPTTFDLGIPCPVIFFTGPPSKPNFYVFRPALKFAF